MKRFAVMLMAVGIFGVMPATAAQLEGEAPKDNVTECVIQADTIQKKIARIQDEVKNGSKKYTPQELKKLNQKLKDANETLDAISKP